MVLPDEGVQGEELRFNVSLFAWRVVSQTKTGMDVGGVTKPSQPCDGCVH